MLGRGFLDLFPVLCLTLIWSIGSPVPVGTPWIAVDEQNSSLEVRAGAEVELGYPDGAEVAVFDGETCIGGPNTDWGDWAYIQSSEPFTLSVKTRWIERPELTSECISVVWLGTKIEEVPVATETATPTAFNEESTAVTDTDPPASQAIQVLMLGFIVVMIVGLAIAMAKSK